MSCDISDRTQSPQTQPTTFNISSERFVSYADPENFNSLDEAKSLFKDFVEYPPTLETALESADIPKIKSILEDSRRLGNKARKQKEIATAKLTDDEASTIACYTLQVEGAQSPYTLINSSVSCSRNVKGLSASKKLIFLFLSGLRKLPRYRVPAGEMLYRGVNKKVPITQ